VLDGTGLTLTLAPNLTRVDVPRFTGMVMLLNSTLSAVLGGTYDASSQPAPLMGSRGYQAITMVGGQGKHAVRNVRALANNSDAAIGVHNCPHAEVSYSDVGGDERLTGRCIWALATRRALIHHNLVRNCSSHSLDLDAYTSGSAAFSNLLLDHGQEGIFVEESASGNLVFNNTVSRAATGIGVYSNVAGPVSNNMIIANTLRDNGQGLSAGGYGHDPNKLSERNLFASNLLEGNGDHNHGQIDPAHGAVSGDYWTANQLLGSGFPYTHQPTDYSAVTIFDP